MAENRDRGVEKTGENRNERRKERQEEKKYICIEDRKFKDAAYFRQRTRNEVSGKITRQNIPRIGRKRTTTPVSHEGKSGGVEKRSGEGWKANTKKKTRKKNRKGRWDTE